MEFCGWSFFGDAQFFQGPPSHTHTRGSLGVQDNDRAGGSTRAPGPVSASSPLFSHPHSQPQKKKQFRPSRSLFRPTACHAWNPWPRLSQTCQFSLLPRKQLEEALLPRPWVGCHAGVSLRVASGPNARQVPVSPRAGDPGYHHGLYRPARGWVGRRRRGEQLLHTHPQDPRPKTLGSGYQKNQKRSLQEGREGRAPIAHGAKGEHTDSSGRCGDDLGLSQQLRRGGLPSEAESGVLGELPHLAWEVRQKTQNLPSTSGRA